MYGNKYLGDEIAREFQKTLTKKAQPAKTAEEQVKPEDFLIAASDSEEKVDSELSGAIDSVASHTTDQVSQAVDQVSQAKDTKEKDAKEEACPVCGKVDCECVESKADDDICMANDADDYYTSNLIDAKAQYVLHELGKMAGKLRQEKKAFAADMVEATALSIQADLVKEASKKLKVREGLEKMAQDMLQEGDFYSADLLKATLAGLKK